MEKANGVREIAVPGEILGKKGKVFSGSGTYEDGDNIVSKFLGVVTRSENYIYVTPLSGVYTPKVNDFVIGIVNQVEKFGWIVDINSPWEGFLAISEAIDEFIDIKKVVLNRYFDVDDVIYAQVVSTRRGDIQLSMKEPGCRKLTGGVLVNITPSKVPRLIGKQGSMVNMIKEKTKTVIRVGQNGIVWINGENIDKAIMAIKLIDQKSHIYGLTDEVSKLLS